MTLSQYGIAMFGFSLVLLASGTQFEPKDSLREEYSLVRAQDDLIPYLYSEVDKRGWNSFQGSWGKRAVDWKNFHGSWGKRILELPVEGIENPIAAILVPEPSIPSVENLETLKRNWSKFSGAWGKRSATDSRTVSPRSTNWSSLRGSWGKRANDWNQFRGMWGKRGDEFDKFLGASGKGNIQESNLDAFKEQDGKATQ